MKDMKSKSTIIIIIIFFLYVMWITPVKGAIEYVETTADADSYVNQAAPAQNYWNQESLAFGNVSSHFYESYLHFYLYDKPENWTSVNLEFQIFFISGPLDLVISVVENNWYETNITWNTKPAQKQVIETLTVSEEKIYLVDLSSYVHYLEENAFWESENEISIRLNASDSTQTGFALAWSSEVDEMDVPEIYSPRVVWTYGEPDFYPLPSYEIAIVIGSIIGITIILISKKYLKNYKIRTE